MYNSFIFKVDIGSMEDKKRGSKAIDRRICICVDIAMSKDLDEAYHHAIDMALSELKDGELILNIYLVNLSKPL